MENSTNIEKQVYVIHLQLKRSRRRFARWFWVCLVFAFGVSFIALRTKEAVFAVIAGFAWFFVWNRWKCWMYFRSLSPKAPLHTLEDQKLWANATWQAFHDLPRWWKSSELAAGITLAIFGTGFVVLDLMIGGLRTRILILSVIAAAVLGLTAYAYRIKYAQAKRKKAWTPKVADIDDHIT